MAWRRGSRPGRIVATRPESLNARTGPIEQPGSPSAASLLKDRSMRVGGPHKPDRIDRDPKPWKTPGPARHGSAQRPGIRPFALPTVAASSSVG